MTSDRRSAVAIVGAGASGTILAAQLARRGIATMLIGSPGRFARGIAYSTGNPAHVLNVRAESMSAWADDPGHFARHVEAEGGSARGFAERRLFGRYLGDILDEAVASGFVEPIAATVTAAARDCGEWSLTLNDGSTVRADALVLASGNQPPDLLRAFADAGDRVVANPWGEEAQEVIADLAETGGDVLLIGTGLTMVDVVLSLSSAGHQGRIVAVSRRGQVPRAHADFAPVPAAAEEVPTGDLRALWRWLRTRSAKVGWRAAVDSLRPYSQALWQSLPIDQQRRFLRHARPWWDVHRHRIAPEVAQLIQQRIADGRLQIVAGRIGEVRSDEKGLAVEIRRRGAGSGRECRFDYAINCTGPLHAIDRTRDPLLRNLLDRGAVYPDRLGIGLAVDDRSRASPDRLWALGPLTKGRSWEVVAVPDIREQAAAVAEDISMELGQ